MNFLLKRFFGNLWNVVGYGKLLISGLYKIGSIDFIDLIICYFHVTHFLHVSCYFYGHTHSCQIEHLFFELV